MKIEDVKVGMKVRVLPSAEHGATNKNFSFAPIMRELIGTTQVVEFMHHSGCVKLGMWLFHPDDLEPAVDTNQKPTYPNPPHKHKDVIIAWANGAEVEWKCYGSAEWNSVANPLWTADEYRIKPQKPPEPPKPEWIKVDGVRPEGIPDDTTVEWFSEDGWMNKCKIAGLSFGSESGLTKIMFIRIIQD